MSNLYNEFLEVVTSKNTGKTISKRYNQKYFNSIGKSKLFEEVLIYTNFLEESATINERLVCIKYNLSTRPVCRVCGKRSRFIRTDRRSDEKSDCYKYSEFCSNKCAHTQTGNKISETKLNQSKEKKDSINDKRKITMIQKYGVSYNSQRSDIKEILRKSKLILNNKSAYKLLSNKDWLIEEYVNRGRSSVDIAQELNVNSATVCDYCRLHDIKIRGYVNSSFAEKEIANFITSLGLVVSSNQKIIPPYEVDLLVESNKFSIEFNGMYWHSYDKKEDAYERNKHLSKTVKLKEAGYSCFQIFESEWGFKRDIVESMIASRLGKVNKIYARKCDIREVSSIDSKKFLDSNHLQGNSVSKIKLGLYHNDKLVSIMTFSKSRFNKKYEWELIRYANLKGHSVVGGASKLFKEFIKRYPSSSIISYCDRRYSEGNLYTQLGFEFSHATEVGYYWTDKIHLFNRILAQKSNRRKLLGDKFDPHKSESDNMFESGYRRIWNCGQLVFVYGRNS